MLTATEAPTPTACPSPFFLGVAWEMLLVVEVEVRVKFVPLPIGSSTRAFASAFVMLMAREPATPTLAPLAPEMASTSKVLLGISPETLTVLAFKVAAPPTEAVLAVLVIPIPTPTPTPDPGAPLVGLPLAVVVGLL